MTALLGGRYRPLGRIASGGMGEVWRAEDELLGREVAVKLLRAHVAEDPEFRRRFRSEARIAAGLSDPGVAQVFDYGEAEGVAYLVMELVPGQSLAGILKRDGRLTPEITLDVVHQTARALHAAHSGGIIHRDIKPGNILVTETGVIKITDFGIARVLEAAPVTQTGMLLGTVQYVSPEQVSGDPLTPATDIYSLGVVAYECLAGRAPFVAETQVAVALMHIGEPPPPLPDDVPTMVRDLVMACLSKDPARRPAGARELSERADVLLDALTASGATGLGTLTDPAGWRAEPATEWPREVVSSPDPAGTPPAPPGAYRETGGEAGTAGGRGGTGDVRPGAWRPGTTPQAPPSAVPPAVPPTLPPVAPPTVPPSGPARNAGRGRRRTTMIAAAVAGCAAAVGLGTLAARELGDRPGDGDPARPVVRSSPATETPTARPGRSSPPASRPPIPPTKSSRPAVTPSATVSTSATPTARPSTSPPSSPSPTTPTATPTAPTATPSPEPSATPDPGDTDPPNEET
ncbi:serine/threonine-protein kinase [Streptosporangium sp. NPDC023615]|uniref:serine/threonine-protein kinase n=1 Tax=Streptosporangium sp. NPDC023615 TaxID=3154794 RepID=UPI00342D06C6